MTQPDFYLSRDLLVLNPRNRLVFAKERKGHGRMELEFGINEALGGIILIYRMDITDLLYSIEATTFNIL